MLESVENGLNTAAMLPPSSGSFDFGIATDFSFVGVSADLSARINHHVALFGKAGAFIPFDDPRDLRSEAHAGIRIKW
jgi:hypothetical protein